MSAKAAWERYKELTVLVDELGVRLDCSRVGFDEEFFERMAEPAARAFAEMAELEGGAVANVDEGRQVGHYWLRNSALAPEPALRSAIDETRTAVVTFAREVREGQRRSPSGAAFTDLVVVGIGGSALGPQLVADALAGGDGLRSHFVDNTDPDGIDRVLEAIGGRLATSLVLVISKSGGTVETRNGLLEVGAALRAAGLTPAQHCVAITMAGSKLDQRAKDEDYVAIFPMWDWVGGRTSLFSAVGLLPAALAGVDVEAMLDGARAMDEATRLSDVARNPAAMLALSWYAEGGGEGRRDMVILPYKDRLVLLARYLQQLVMESLGKELDRDGATVEQGIVVYGNKGSTDQHAYVQQLRDGAHNFFATFVDVLADRAGDSLEVEPDVTAGDYLTGFLLGTRRALAEKGRGSVTITLPRVDARTLGGLLALYERAVGLYASLVNVNAYHQPGVEAGKRAAGWIIETQRRVLDTLRGADAPLDVPAVAGALGLEEDADVVFTILEHLAASGHHAVERVPGHDALSAAYRLSS